MSNEKKIEFTKVIHDDGGFFISEPHEAQGFIDADDHPEEYTKEPIRMTRAEFDALPDFAGF